MEGRVSQKKVPVYDSGLLEFSKCRVSLLAVSVLSRCIFVAMCVSIRFYLSLETETLFDCLTHDSPKNCSKVNW